MKCKLMGIQDVNFTAQETGELIQGTKLHVVSDLDEKSSGFSGRRVAAVFTKLNVSGLSLGDTVDLVYDLVLGSNKSRLVAVKKV